MLPYDRWEGYAAERNEILNFISNPDDNPATADAIKNVVFLTTDAHATLVNEVFKDRFTAPATRRAGGQRQQLTTCTCQHR